MLYTIIDYEYKTSGLKNVEKLVEQTVQALKSRSDDDRIVSHDAPHFMLYYHCVRDIS